IRACLPVLQKSRGLVVNITSDAARGAYPGWGGYGSSKAALELLSKTLANELRDAGVGVVAVDPGDLRTQMHQDAFPGQDISDRPLPEVTLPFWAWPEGQDPSRVTGQRFEAQGSVWEVPASSDRNSCWSNRRSCLPRIPLRSNKRPEMRSASGS